jgi:putative endonuclease
MRGRLVQLAVRALDAVADRLPWSRDSRPGHIRTGERGEEDAYFWLRRQGYVMVARNWRSAHVRGDLDLIAYKGSTLCFIEVKSRTTHDVAPPEAAVDRDKQRQLRMLGRDYLRRAARAMREKADPPYRFDIVSVQYDGGRKPKFELFQNAF